MNAPTRLVAFVVGLIVLFGTSYVVAGAVVPERVVEDWTRSAQESDDHSSPSAPVVESHGDVSHQDTPDQEEGS